MLKEKLNANHIRWYPKIRKRGGSGHERRTCLDLVHPRATPGANRIPITNFPRLQSIDQPHVCNTPLTQTATASYPPLSGFHDEYLFFGSFDFLLGSGQSLVKKMVKVSSPSLHLLSFHLQHPHRAIYSFYYLSRSIEMVSRVITALFVWLYSIPSSTQSTSLSFALHILPLRLPTVTQKLTISFPFFIGASLGPL